MHHLSICSKCGYGHSSDTCVTDDEVVAWFDSQSEEFLAALPGYEDGLTPRRAWNEFFSSSPATEAAPASSPAPVLAGQGEGTKQRKHPDGCTCVTCAFPADYSARFAPDSGLADFNIWLEAKASAASKGVYRSSAYPTIEELGHLYVIAGCRAAIDLLMQFKRCVRTAAAARGPACGDTSAAGEAAINFGGYGGAYPSSVPVGNTGTTSTGQGV